MPRSPPEISTHRPPCAGHSACGSFWAGRSAAGRAGSAFGSGCFSSTMTRVGSSAMGGTAAAGFAGAGCGTTGPCAAGSSLCRSKVSSNSSSYKSRILLSCSLPCTRCTGRRCFFAPTACRLRPFLLRSKSGARRGGRALKMGFDKTPLNNIAQFAEKRKWKLPTFSRSFHFFTVSSYSRPAAQAVSTSAGPQGGPAGP